MSAVEYVVRRAEAEEGWCGTCHDEMPVGTLVLQAAGQERLCEACARALVASPRNWPGSDDPAEEYGNDARAIADALGLDYPEWLAVDADSAGSAGEDE